MEGLFILIALIALQAGAAWIKKRGESQHRNFPPDASGRNEYDSDENREEDSPEDDGVPSGTPDSLRELIRKFREEQEKRSIEPPPVLRPEENLEPELHQSRVPEESSAPVSVPSVSPMPAPVNPYAAYAGMDSSREGLAEDEIAASSVERSRPVEIALPVAHPASPFEFDKKEARKGFLWAKVLDDPRFRRRNPVPFNPFDRG